MSTLGCRFDAAKRVSRSAYIQHPTIIVGFYPLRLSSLLILTIYIQLSLMLNQLIKQLKPPIASPCCWAVDDIQFFMLKHPSPVEQWAKGNYGFWAPNMENITMLLAFCLRAHGFSLRGYKMLQAPYAQPMRSLPYTPPQRQLTHTGSIF